MVYPRKILQELRKNKDTKEIIVLTGIRRSGKTTVYRMLFDEIKSKNKVFLDLENPIEQKTFEEKDYNNIWANLVPYNVSQEEKAYIFLDEVQAMPNVVRAVKYLYDHYQVKFFLTGSSSFYFKNIFPESLAGRKFVFELYPLDFEEFLLFRNVRKHFYDSFSEKDKNKNAIAFEKVKKLYEEYISYGGFPQVVLEKNLSQKTLQLNDIFKSYFEKDVKVLADFRDINVFRDLLLLLLRRAGSKLDISKLASEIGIARETVYSYLSFLKGTYFITLISPFAKSVDREVSGAKKVYVCDTGLLRQFAGVDNGALLENAVFNSLRKYGEICYYQKRSGGELDFVLNERIGLEVKTKGIESDLHKLRKLAHGLHLKESYVLTKEFSNIRGFIPTIEI